MDQSEIVTGQSTRQQQEDAARNSAEVASYLEDEDRIAKIGAIMVQAFGIKGRTLSDAQYAEILPGWQAGFRGVATVHLDKLRADGLARRCWSVEQFVAVYEGGMEAEARERFHEIQQKKFQEHKDQSVPRGQSSPAKEKCFATWRAEGLLK